VALLHDVCKTGYYRRERDGKYSVKDQLPMLTWGKVCVSGDEVHGLD